MAKLTFWTITWHLKSCFLQLSEVQISLEQEAYEAGDWTLSQYMSRNTLLELLVSRLKLHCFGNWEPGYLLLIQKPETAIKTKFENIQKKSSVIYEDLSMSLSGKQAFFPKP